MKCRKFGLKVEDNCCEIADCEYRKTCMGASVNIETINPIEIKEKVVPEPKIESDVVESEIIEPLNTKELKSPDFESLSIKQLRLNHFHVKKVHDGVDVSMKISFSADITLFMSKTMAVAMSKALQKHVLKQK